MIYLDNSATTCIAPEVRQAMGPYLNECYFNPSSLHMPGQNVRKAIINARKTAAAAINCAPGELFFTGSGTEANNMALIQARGRGKHIVTSAAEHMAVISPCKALENEGFSVTYLPVDSYGCVSPEQMEQAIRPDTALISLMLVNNELGSINPIAEIAEIARTKGILVHTDAVQALGKIEVDVDKLNIDMLSFSGHKIHAPKGVGALFIRESLVKSCKPLIYGGGQESGLRSGTENVPYIVGLAAACSIIDVKNDAKHMRSIKNTFDTQIMAQIPDVRINGDPQNSVCSISSVTFRGIKAENLFAYLPDICFSLGSACKGKNGTHSHVLSAAGMSEKEMEATARFSFSRYNTQDEITEAVQQIANAVNALRQANL